MPSATSPLQPTWVGFVQETREALILFEAVIQGALHRVTRRPHDRERAALIRSGSIFIYEEGASGIKRWTDGVSWSPSRILNNFLIYRELEKPFPPGEKKRAKPKNRQSEGMSSQSEGEASVSSPSASSSVVASPTARTDNGSEKDSKRSLVGSLTESYNFKEPGGLVKKTMSVVVSGSHFHLVSYYDPDDVENGLLERPINTNLKWIRVRQELISRQNFRAPIDEADEAMQSSASWGQPVSRGPYVSPAGGPPSYMQPDYMQQAGQPGAMSPQSPSYGAQWGQQQDPRSAYGGDHRYSFSTSSPVHGQNPYMSSHVSPMPPQLHMRTEFGQQYPQSPYSADQRYQQQLQEQQQHAAQHPQHSAGHQQHPSSQPLQYGQAQYPGSPSQQSPMGGWNPR